MLAETGGNPLFLTELLQEPATPERLPDTMPIPPSLPVLIGRRLRQLPESGRQVNVEPDQQAVLHELAT